MSFDIENGILRRYIGKDTHVVIPSGVTHIGYCAFRDCRALERVELPDSVVSVDGFAFARCSNLRSLYLPSSVTSFHGTALSECSSLTSLVVAPENTVYHSRGNCVIQTAKTRLVAGCKTSVIPDDGSVTVIAMGAFSTRVGLAAVVIPNTVRVLEAEAFRDCASL